MEALGRRRKEVDMDERYESWEVLADEVDVGTGTADCWTCLLVDA